MYSATLNQYDVMISYRVSLRGLSTMKRWEDLVVQEINLVKKQRDVVNYRTSSPYISDTLAACTQLILGSLQLFKEYTPYNLTDKSALLTKQTKLSFEGTEDDSVVYISSRGPILNQVTIKTIKVSNSKLVFLFSVFFLCQYCSHK